MQNFTRCRTHVIGRWLLITLVLGGLWLPACTPAAAPVTQPNGGGPKPTHTAAFVRATDPTQAIARLKDMPGKDITVDSGEGTWRSFLENDLWDGIDMLIHPLVIGNGTPLFDSLSIKVPLRLVESKTYENGVVNLRYERM